MSAPWSKKTQNVGAVALWKPLDDTTAVIFIVESMLAVTLTSYLSLSGSLPNVLQEAEIPLVDQDLCQQQLPEYTITSSMLCAGYQEGGVDSCQVTSHLDSKHPP